MEYTITNKLSKSGIKKTSSDMLDVSSITSEFFDNLTSDDTVHLYGGDGTINKFLNNCQEFPKLIIYPTGTGNDLARSLTTDFQQIPIFEVNGTKFINSFDIGFGAEVCKLVNENLPKRRFSYISSVYRTLIRLRTFSAKVTIDGCDYKFAKNFIIAVQNTKYFGGGMKIAPGVTATEPNLGVYVIGNASKLVIATIFPSVFFGKHTIFRKYVKAFNAKQVEIVLADQHLAEVDGELLEPAAKFCFKSSGHILVRKAD